MDNEQLGFFDDEKEGKISIATGLNVAKLSFVEGISTTWKELFSGFDKLNAITYSSGIGFVSNLVDMFEYTEIIFGCEQVMSYSISEVMAFQTKLLEKIKSSKQKENLISHISDNSLRFFVTRKKLSHEKIYLLSAKDGRRRVIMGSANMSYQAFSGNQRENICCIDGSEAYDWYMDTYLTLKEDCTDEISAKALLIDADTENLDQLPIAGTVKIKKVLEIVPDNDGKEEVEFYLDVNNITAKYKALTPKAEKSGRIVLSPQIIVQMKNHAKEYKEKEREKRREFPQLIIDTESKHAELNGEKLDLDPSEKEIRNDVDLFIQYMQGYSNFHGDYQYVQNRYFVFANWFFCSPFMAIMRDTAKRYNQQSLPYPVFGLIYGQSKAGKTSFLETLLKMMIGQKTRLSAPEFTRKSIDGLRFEVKGAPIIVDDLTQARFSQHAVETIKNDDFGLSERNVHYPAVVISANEDVKAVAQEIIRRTVICRVQIGLTNTEVMKSNIVRKVQKNIGTAFFREYVRRMFEIVPDMVEELKDDNVDVSPDILSASSRIICDIIEEYYSEGVPDYIRQLSLEDYFSEKVTGNHAIQTIRTAWKANRACFTIKKKTNKLLYQAGQSYDADRIIKELPETLEPKKSNGLVIMNLEEAKSFFDIDFKNSFFDRIKNRK